MLTYSNIMSTIHSNKLRIESTRQTRDLLQHNYACERSFLILNIQFHSIRRIYDD